MNLIDAGNLMMLVEAGLGPNHAKVISDQWRAKCAEVERLREAITASCIHERGEFFGGCGAALSPPEPTEGQADLLRRARHHINAALNLIENNRLALAVQGRALIREIDALRAMPLQDHVWRPIETAPKDGTHVLTFTPSRQPPHAVYHWSEEPGRPSHAKWMSEDGSWYVKGPTHWMPLDAPMVAEKEPER